MYFAYILKSQKTGRFYYGSTGDLENRLKTHNAGKVKPTKPGRPWAVHHFEEFPTRAEAMGREKFFKSIDGYRYLKENGIT